MTIREVNSFFRKKGLAPYLILTLLLMGVKGKSSESFRDSSVILSPALQEKLESSSPGEPLRLIIALNKGVREDFLSRDLEFHPRKERQRIVVERLKQFAEENHRGILRALRDMGAIEVHSLWINNVIIAKVTKEMVSDIVGIRGIEYLDVDEMQNVLLVRAGLKPVPTESRTSKDE
jgi:hypothetical protein